MTPLERALRERIQAEGPITVEAYMEACNAYYYATRDPLGARGDFTTAPEISQMFGEMIGAALADCWRRAGRRRSDLCRAWPRRGTLAADALRMMGAAGFEGDVILSKPARFCATCSEAVPVRTGTTRSTICPRAALLVANEFLDALPCASMSKASNAGGGRRRRLRLRPRRGDRRNFAGPREAVNSIATCLAAKGGARSSSTTAMNERARRHLAGGARPRLRAGAGRIRGNRI